ncbi:MAG: hypothetical protein U0326_17385 [Polyangiales bacterium]
MSHPIEANAILGGRYRLIEPVADRGMGEVWRVGDERREGAALLAKFLRAVEGDDLSTQTLAAVRALKALRHPAVPTTFAHGVHQGRPWVVLDDVPGESLGVMLDRARARGELVELGLLRRVFEAVAGALTAAHTAALPLVQGVVAPGSVIVLSKPSPRAPCALLDLGLMPWLDAPREVSTKSARVLVAHAPERLRGDDPTVATDVFGLGALLTEMLALPAPEGATLAAVTDARRRPDVGDRVWAVLANAMAPSPGARPTSVAALMAALEPTWNDAPPQGRSRLAALLDPPRAQPAVSLLETVAPVVKGPSLTPSPRAMPASAPLAPLAPLPLAVENGLPMPAPVAAQSASARLAQLMDSFPAEPNPWATEVRQREVAMPSPLVSQGPASPNDDGPTQVLGLSSEGATPRAAATMVASASNTAPRDVGDGATLVARFPLATPLDAEEGETLVAAPRPPSAPPINRLADVLAAHEIPMNVPDGTLVAAPPGTARPLAPVAPPVTPIPRLAPAQPAASKNRVVAAIGIVLALLVALAALWGVRG